MPLFSTISHSLRATRWRFRGNVVDFQSRSRLIEQLRLAQGDRVGKVQPFQIGDGARVLNAQYRLAMAPRARPQYFEYTVLNSGGSVFAVANGIIGYRDSNNASHGVVLMTTLRGEVIGHYDYLGSRATMELSGGTTSLLCQWESATRSDASSAIIYAGSVQHSNEVCQIKGLSRGEELGGAVPKYSVLRGNEILMEIYPEGQWGFNPWRIWKRLACDTVPVIAYFGPLLNFVEQDSDLAERVTLASLCACRALSWPILPFDAPLGNV
jgi:hypothetical protein